MKKLIWMLFLGFTSVFLLAQDGPEMGVELGFQSLDVTGNEDVFRTQVNSDDGLLLNAFYYNLIDADDQYRGFDRIRIDASGFGASPQGHFRLQAEKAGLYDLRLSYLRMEHYNALPGYANPFLNQDIVPGQHTLDRVRDTLDFQLKFTPSKAWQPYLAFSQSSYDGPGRSTYHLGQDEFQIVNDRSDKETEVRLGLAFDLGKFQGELAQGWRNLDTEENVSLLTGTGSGNNIREVLGREIELDSLERQSQFDADMPTTTFHINGELHERVRVLGSYIRTELESTLDEQEMAMGSLASFQISRFYDGLNETISSDTDGEQWRAHLQADVLLPANWKWRVSWTNLNRDLNGHALITTLYTDAVTFGNSNPQDFLNQLDARTYVEREEERLETTITTPNLRGFRLWAGFTRASVDSRIDADLAEIVVTGGQGGDFERDVDTIRAGAMYKKRHHQIKVEWESKSADELVLRTDFDEWTKRSVRFKTRLAKWFHLTGRALWVDQENDHPDIALTSDHTNYGVDALLNVKKAFNARVSYGVFDFESDVRIIQPQDFTWSNSFHREDGNELEFDLSYHVKSFEIRAQHAQYESEGLLDFELDRSQFQFGYTFANNLAAVLVYGTQDYEEDALVSADYDSESIAVLLRWSR